MRIAQAACNIFVDNHPFAWRAAGALGLSLIVLTVLIHVSSILLISQGVVHGSVGRMFE